MRENDRQLGRPLRAYIDNQAAIEALSLGALDEGCVGYASDIDAIGSFDGTTWSWLTIPTGAGTAALGAGAASQLAYWSAVNTLSGEAGLVYANNILTLLSSAATRPTIEIENTHAGAAAPTIDFYKNSVSPTDNDDLGAIDFYGENSGGTKTRYAYILSESLDVTGGDEAGALVFVVEMDSVSRNLLELLGYNGAVNEGEVIINQAGQDVDFRVEAVGEINALFVRGSDGSVGIGTIPDRLFHAEASDAVTAAITYGQRLTHITSGTAAELFGVGEEHELESYDGVRRIASEVVTLWAMALARAQTSLRRWTAFSNGSAGPGYAGFGTVRGLSAPSVDIIPNGAGDVARGGRFVYCIYLNTAAAFLSGTIEATPGGGAVDLYNVGADQFTLTVAANGSVSVVRAAGTDSADIAISATWL